MLAKEGTTPAKLRVLKETIPAARRLTKTDLAKYLNAWDKKADLVSLGAQKNFDRFMSAIMSDHPDAKLPVVGDYKAMIAKAKIFREIHKLV